MIERLRQRIHRLLFGRKEECIYNDCSNPRRGAPNPAPMLCAEHYRAQQVEAEARFNVATGASRAAYAINCTDCPEMRIQTVAEGEEPNRDCENCGSGATIVTVIDDE